MMMKSSCCDYIPGSMRLWLCGSEVFAVCGAGCRDEEVRWEGDKVMDIPILAYSAELKTRCSIDPASLILSVCMRIRVRQLATEYIS